MNIDVPEGLKLPNWLEETPTPKFFLQMDEHGGEVAQSIEMSLVEFDDLKDVLGAMRGDYGPTERQQVLDGLRTKFEIQGQPTAEEPSTNSDMMQMCQKLLAEESDLVTPFEKFFYSIVIMAQVATGNGNHVTPDNIREEWATFRRDYDYMARHSQTFQDRKPTKEAVDASHQ